MSILKINYLIQRICDGGADMSFGHLVFKDAGVQLVILDVPARRYGEESASQTFDRCQMAALPS